ncbi:MAG TPA: LysE family transporter [Candidatus Binatia bacterium]|nr:LysE family transporter [Candidatus Binatia bacterium]
MAPPGPVMAIMSTASTQGRPREAIRTALGAMTADATWLALVTLGFLTVLRRHPRIVGALGVTGGVMLLGMAWDGIRTLRRGAAASSARGSYRLGLMTVLASPFSFGWWMASGPIVISSLGATGIAGLFLSILIYAVAISYALAWLGARVAHTATVFAWIGILMLAGFGVLFIAEGARLVRG